jgi:hypothetical protein
MYPQLSTKLKKLKLKKGKIKQAGSTKQSSHEKEGWGERGVGR